MLRVRGWGGGSIVWVGGWALLERESCAGELGAAHKPYQTKLNQANPTKPNNPCATLHLQARPPPRYHLLWSGALPGAAPRPPRLPHLQLGGRAPLRPVSVSTFEAGRPGVGAAAGCFRGAKVPRLLPLDSTGLGKRLVKEAQPPANAPACASITQARRIPRESRRQQGSSGGERRRRRRCSQKGDRRRRRQGGGGSGGGDRSGRGSSCSCSSSGSRWWWRQERWQKGCKP